VEIWDEIKRDSSLGAKRLVDEYGDRLMKTAYRLCSSRETAEDLTFRTLSQAVSHIGQFDRTVSFFGWLRRILVNFHQMDMRRKGANALDLVDAPPDVADDRPDPAETLAAKTDAAAVRMAVALLKSPFRETVVLHYFDGLDVAEIARVMSVPAGTVKFRLHSARRKMREILSPTFFGQGAF